MTQRSSRARSALARAFLSRRFPLYLLGAFAVWFAAWAIRPPHLSDFFLEHLLTVAAIGLLAWSYRSFRLSNFSYLLLFLFLSLHVVGAHYTYAEVPYESWLRTAAGWLGADGFDVRASLGLSRNHFDRLVHFAFGLLCAYPARELFVRVAQARGFWGYYLPFDMVLSASMIYELLEWGVAVIVAGDVGQSYLGTQGDEWDAQKDMFLAAIGAFVAMIAAGLVHWRLERDFASELAESLRVKQKEPLGEVEVAKWLHREGS